ncbi:MAG: twin-arginine translocase TatA/TatE family subunit [Longimicrobiales bacterium]|jgi:sec-independent protein translocase protein TatA|nr:twin-arginine translocase TatA/TatE family subunit [Longimicrobiales bacterium]|tara:strand:+ start:3493 stop:3690 length:198 start_codon:yes stop_codon:yes gene_type:complete
MMGLGFGEVLLILLILLFFFGAKKIPIMAKGLGTGIRNFKGELKKPESTNDDETTEDSIETEESY